MAFWATMALPTVVLGPVDFPGVPPVGVDSGDSVAMT
jgi:hypothetical protein